MKSDPISYTYVHELGLCAAPCIGHWHVERRPKADLDSANLHVKASLTFSSVPPFPPLLGTTAIAFVAKMAVGQALLPYSL